MSLCPCQTVTITVDSGDDSSRGLHAPFVGLRMTRKDIQDQTRSIQHPYL
jgi:hypothetical protein